jgi:dolichol-phosphate hexosyltransferase
MLSILMPVYNERERVERAISEVLDTPLPTNFELIVVNDGSTDGTTEILDRSRWDGRVRLIHHEVNRGKGAAVRTALREARGEFSAVFDADLEYHPGDLTLLLPPLLDGRANACFGVRVFDGYTSHSFLYVLGNRAVTLACNIMFNVYLHDIMTCHKVIRTDLFRRLRLRASGFAIEPEITARLIQRRERIFEVPVQYRARATEEGKKLTAIDGFRVLGTLLRCRFLPQAGRATSATRYSAMASSANGSSGGQKADEQVRAIAALEIISGALD